MKWTHANITEEGYMHFILFFFNIYSVSGFIKYILPSPDKKWFVSVCTRGPRENVFIYFKFLHKGSA